MASYEAFMAEMRDAAQTKMRDTTTKPLCDVPYIQRLVTDLFKEFSHDNECNTVNVSEENDTFSFDIRLSPSSDDVHITLMLPEHEQDVPYIMCWYEHKKDSSHDAWGTRRLPCFVQGVRDLATGPLGIVVPMWAEKSVDSVPKNKLIADIDWI